MNIFLHHITYVSFVDFISLFKTGVPSFLCRFDKDNCSSKLNYKEQTLGETFVIMKADDENNDVTEMPSSEYLIFTNY